MSSMTQDETYNGYANRETWAFNLHWQNDQGLYNETLAVAAEALNTSAEVTDRELGGDVVTYWHDMINEWDGEYGTGLPVGLAMFRDEVGSWWRIDHAEVGACVRESLEVEGESPAT